jgi:hypothetical protein
MADASPTMAAELASEIRGDKALSTSAADAYQALVT